jgi:hypothetical protein
MESFHCFLGLLGFCAGGDLVWVGLGLVSCYGKNPEKF